jgi:hypothetical protein
MADYGVNGRGDSLRDAMNALYPMTGLGNYSTLFPPNTGVQPSGSAPVPIPPQRPPTMAPPPGPAINGQTQPLGTGANLPGVQYQGLPVPMNATPTIPNVPPVPPPGLQGQLGISGAPQRPTISGGLNVPVGPGALNVSGQTGLRPGGGLDPRAAALLLRYAQGF